jgi:hypothetical protein
VSHLPGMSRAGVDFGLGRGQMSTNGAQNTPKLVTALDDIDRWRRESDTEADREHAEISDEQEKIRKEIADREQRLDALGQRKTEVEGHKASLPGEQLRRQRDASLKNLAGDRGLIAARGSLYGDAVKVRERRVTELIEQPEYNKLVGEYEEFQEIEVTLDTLPKSYRTAIESHHANVTKQLEPVFDAMAADIEQVDATAVSVAAIASIDAPDGVPEALAVIVPTPYEICSKWSERAEDLSTLIAYRVVGAIGGMLKAIGAADAPIQFAEYENALAIQVWLGDSEVQGNLKPVLEDLFDELNGKAAEFEAGRISIGLVWLDPECIAPDDDAEEGN